MSNWKIVGKIAAGSGVISVVFGVFAAILTYQANAGYYPINTILMAIFSVMLNPYLLLAALSFVVAWFALHADNETPALVTGEETPPASEPQAEEPKP